MILGSSYDIKSLAAILQVKRAEIKTNSVIKRIAIDSRKVFSGEDVLFIALNACLFITFFHAFAMSTKFRY